MGNEEEKEDEYVTPGGDDIQLELMNGYGAQGNVQSHDDDEKEAEYVTAGGPDMDLHESGDDEPNIDDVADDDDDVLLDGIGATLGNVEEDEKNDELHDSDDDVLVGVTTVQ